MSASPGKTALYLRLSRDDEKAGESLSIENQRAILRKFVAESGGTVVGEYVDDGWSGTNFERPAVRRMLEDAKGGKLDTIVVKDLSRFGRNYIQVGQYVDYLFPAYGIRFIALADNVDTADRMSAGMDMMPILNVFNEWHAANTSKKIRAVLESDWRRGRYTNWAYPYGYRAGGDEKRTAVVDERAAAVVRRIFALRLQGDSVQKIARTLTDEGIPNPTAHYTRLDGGRSERRNAGAWSPKTVAAILRDQTYIGTLTQHRTARVSYKNHAVQPVPASEHFVTEHAHEAIVAREVFERVQAMRQSAPRGRADKAGRVHPLSGLLVCADCGKKMKYASPGRKARQGGYLCRTYADLGKSRCTSHAISERQIESVLLQDLRSMLGGADLGEAAAREHFLAERAKRREKSRQADERAARALRNRLAELDRLIASAFEEKVLGGLPESVCADLCRKYRAEKDAAERDLARAEGQTAPPQGADAGADEYLARYRRCARCEELTRELCLRLVERIVVGEKAADGAPRHIHIFYRFSP